MEQDKLDVASAGTSASLPPLSSAAAVPQKAAPTAPTTPAPAVPQRAAAPTLAQKVNQAQGRALPLPKGLKQGNTNDIESPYLHLILYSETDARKTTTAAMFGTPEQTRIILTRNEEQLIPLKSLGYQYVKVEDADALEFAMCYPERIWPDWAQRDDRLLIVDDITQGKDMFLDDNSTMTDASGNEREIKDNRKVHVGAKRDMQLVARAVLAKPQHVIFIALSRVANNEITGEEYITPDLPPAMFNMLGSDFEFCFYVSKRSWTLLTEEDRTAYQKKNDKGELQSFVRKVFGKHKLPKSLEGKGIIKKSEPLDLRALWNRIQQAKVAMPGGTK